MGQTFTKTYAKGQVGSPPLEAAGLAWLAQAETTGGARTAKVVGLTSNNLVLEQIVPSRPTASAAQAIGQALAHTHAAGASHFGAPPLGWTGSGAIGLAPLSYVSDPKQYLSWGHFYFIERLVPYAEIASQKGSLPKGGMSVLEALGERLMAGLFDSPQPALCPRVARIHGDLWAGNLLFEAPPAAGSQRQWTGARLIDPAAQGGHAETDLAMLALFGAPMLNQVLAAYNLASPLADGWKTRIDLHQLHPLLVHAALFGGSYGLQAITKAKHYL